MRRAIVILLVLASGCLVAAPAQAARSNSPLADVAAPIIPVPSPAVTPPGFAITAGRALHVAETTPRMQALHRAEHPLQYQVYTWGLQHYEIYFWFRGRVVADVIVSRTGRLGQVWTGPLAMGVYARGHYGQVFDSPWTWLGFVVMFLIPLARLRGRSWLDVLDIAAVLGFALSYALFDHLQLEPAVWLAYPPLLYLMARMLRRGVRPRPRRLEIAMPIKILAAGLVLLAAARVALTLMPPVVMDVGYASAIGAYKILHGQSIYYVSLGHPDTYGPIAYLAYVPFAAIWHVTGWNYVPAARAATITFDLLTIVGLVFLGRRLRPGREGMRLGLTLGWLWAACPFTLLGMVKSTNDGLVALLAVLMLLAMSGPLKRGFLLGLAAAAKFFPAILFGLIVAGRREGRAHDVRKAAAGFVIAVGASVAIFLPAGGLKEMYDHTIGFQLSRADIFSPWALHPGLAPIKLAIEGGVAILAVALAFWPRGPRSLAQVSALAGALVIGVQLPALHWFYLYIVWFFPFVLVAVLGAETRAGPALEELIEPHATVFPDEPSPELVPAS